MAKVGYIYLTAGDDSLVTEKEWMEKYGCVQVFEEKTEHEKLRPRWQQLISSLERGDELVLVKFSNAVRGVSELSHLLELCRVKMVRIISLRDCIDSADTLFPNTTTSKLLEVIGSLPEEVLVLRRATAHIEQLKKSVPKVPKTTPAKNREERGRIIVSMYNAGHDIDDIWRVSGFRSRSSVFRILNLNGVELNRGKFRGPLGPRQPKEQQAQSQAQLELCRVASEEGVAKPKDSEEE